MTAKINAAGKAGMTPEDLVSALLCGALACGIAAAWPAAVSLVALIGGAR